MGFVEDERERLPLLGRLAFDVEELRRVGDGLEGDDERLGQMQRQQRALAWRQLDAIEHDTVDDVRKIAWQIDPRTPEHLPHIVPHRQAVGIVGGDPADAGADRERHLDHFVERRLISGGAEGAVVFCLIDRFQRGAGIEHAAAARAEHVPGHVEQAQPRRMQESRGHLLIGEAVACRESQGIDAIEIGVDPLANQGLDGRGDLWLGGTTQDLEQRRLITHGHPPRR